MVKTGYEVLMGDAMKTGYVLLCDLIGETLATEFKNNGEIKFMHGNITYRFLYNEDRIFVYDNHMRIGTLILRGRDKFDCLASIIVGIETGRISFGCGQLDITLPKAMPPEHLNFWTYLVSKRPGGIRYNIKKTLIYLTLPMIISSSKDPINDRNNVDDSISYGYAAILSFLKGAIIGGYLIGWDGNSRAAPVYIFGIGILFLIVEVGIAALIQDYRKWKVRGGIE